MALLRPRMPTLPVLVMAASILAQEACPPIQEGFLMARLSPMRPAVGL
jgi:hypothetical protein